MFRKLDVDQRDDVAPTRATTARGQAAKSIALEDDVDDLDLLADNSAPKRKTDLIDEVARERVIALVVIRVDGDLLDQLIKRSVPSQRRGAGFPYR